MKTKYALSLFIAATVVVMVNFLTPIVCLAMPGEGTDPDTGLNTQQQTWARDSKIQQLMAELQAHLADKNPADNSTMFQIMGQLFEYLVAKTNEPQTTAPAAQAAGQAQANAAGNAAGDVARDQAIQSIDYASRFLKNFTTEKGNKWNSLRDNIFVPIALLLILPGAVLTQVKCIIAAGSPVIQQSNPFEGIQRSIIAVFLIPGTYLIVNYGIDFANSIQYTIATEYTRLFGTNMYRDAICAEIRAFGVRYISENDGSLNTPPADQNPTSNGNFSAAEAKLWGKLVDPCTGLKRVPRNRDDASMPASSIAARLMMNASNAGINTSWAILCAFQMAFFYYLYFVGPIMAALWVWPLKTFRDAFPSWVEGVVTLCFWSLFWHTTILLMACFKGTDETGLFVMTALNFLATACVKNAFDFAGLVRAAGQKVSDLIEKGNQGSGGGGGGAGGQSANQSQGKGNSQFVSQQQVSAYQGHGSTNKYQDKDGDGKVDGVWDSNTGSYAPPPPGQDMYLLSPSYSSGSGSAIPPDITPPPPTNGAPQVMINQDSELAYYNATTNQYDVPKVLDQNNGQMVAQFKVDENGRVAEWTGKGYEVPQTIDRESKASIDKYLIKDGALEQWDQASDTYKPMATLAPAATAPPVADPQPTYPRTSVSSQIGDAFFPIMHYPLSAKLRDADAPNEELEFDHEKANAWELMEFAVQKLKEQESQTPKNTNTQPSSMMVPQLEKDTNMSNQDQIDDISDLRLNAQKDWAVAPPPLTFSPPEQSTIQPLEINSQTIEAIKQTVPIVNLEAEIEKLFQRMTSSSNVSTQGLFVSRDNDDAYKPAAHVSTFAPRSAEELLASSDDDDNQSALARALGRAFIPASTESTNRNDGLW